MRITELELTGYIRLHMAGLNYIKICPNNPYQVIIGTNGSGKSSLLYELSPLPGHKDNYDAGGSKVIKLEDGKNTYVLSSFFESKPRHVFELNGVNLNDGGTYTVQKDLVKKHLNYDTELHDLLMGYTRFTSMSPGKRREWIVRLSGNDLDYAFGVHQSIMSLHRDKVGVVKHLNQRLTVETDKMLSSEAVEELKKTEEILTEEIGRMMLVREPDLSASSVILDEIKFLMKKIESIGNTSRHIPLTPFVGRLFNKHKISSVEELDSVIEEMKRNKAVNDSSLRHLQDEYSELQEIVSAMSDNSEEAISLINERIAQIRNDIVAKRGSLIDGFIEGDVSSIVSDIESVSEPLMGVVSTLNNVTSHRYERQRIDEIKEEVRITTLKIDKASRTLANTEERIRHIKEAKEENCPKCGWRWRPGISEYELKDLEEKSNQIQVYITEHEKTLNDHLLTLKETQEVVEAIGYFRNLVVSYPRLHQFWEKTRKDNLFRTTPLKIMQLLDRYKHDAKVSLSISDLETELNELEKTIENSKKMGIDGSVQLTKRMGNLESKINRCTEDSIRLRKEIEEVTAYSNAVSKFLSSALDVFRFQTELVDRADLYTRSYRNEIIATGMMGMQRQLASVSDKLSYIGVMDGLIRSLEKDKKEQEFDRDVLKSMANELSPTDGLIAELLNQFNNALVEQMNAIISNVWTYEMEIKPCAPDSMDFKFPLWIKGGEQKPSDVSRGSTAQQDMVDFAFKLVVMLYMGMENSPLFLDELAASFDEQHRVNIVRYIHDLMESSGIPQLWMISHYFSNHGSFAHAEVCALDTTNIVNKPGVFNKHVIMH